MVVAVIIHWRDIGKLTAYGYLGAFFISLFGGGTIIAPIPMLPTVFALGTVMKPSFAPYLGPIFVGIAAGLGDTLGGMTTYMAGCGGGAVALGRNNTRFQSMYARLEGWMRRRGGLVVFAMSALVNPFFYPIALTAGALRFGVWKFFLITWGGKTIKQISVAAAGYWGLGSLLRMFGVPI